MILNAEKPYLNQHIFLEISTGKSLSLLLQLTSCEQAACPNSTTAVGFVVSHKSADEKEKELHRRKQKEQMIEMLSEYKSLCRTRKVMLVCS